jgi:CheY-like chemotaxis protein
MHPAKDVICVVDDDPSILKAVVRLLCAAGFETVPFESPRLFLEYVECNSVSAAIIDLRMPELSGLDVQRELSNISPKVAVVIITGEDEFTADREVAVNQGAIAFLHKPVQVAELLDAINRATDLEPCPFCGQGLLEVRQTNGLRYSQILPVSSETNPVVYWVLCRSCNGGGPLANSKREARLLWNRRQIKKSADSLSVEFGL